MKKMDRFNIEEQAEKSLLNLRTKKKSQYNIINYSFPSACWEESEWD